MTRMLLPPSEWEQLMQGILRRRYQLLTGAGFSADVLDHTGKPLPSGTKLRDELVRDFDLPIQPDESIELMRAYEAAGRRRTADGLTRAEWFRARFTQTNPPDWFSILGLLPFRTVWTLNIDDSVEQSLGGRLYSRVFSEKNDTPPSDSVHLVHLHGSAKKIDLGLVFSIAEYRASTTGPRSYALQFEESLSDSPVIVVGASLANEFDLARALRDRAHGSGDGPPSVIVMPDPTDFQREEFESWGLTVVDSTGKVFFEAVRESLAQTQAELAPHLARENAINPSMLRFEQQWSRFAQGQGRIGRYRDFLAGSEPLPNDVTTGYSIARDIESRLRDELVEGDQPILLTGIPFSGKSTVCTRVLVSLDREGWEVYEFSGEDRLDATAVLRRVVARPNTILYVDDAGLYANELSLLLTRAAEDQVAIRILCTDRTGPASRLLRWDHFRNLALGGSLSSVERADFIRLLDLRDRVNEQWRDKSLKSLEAKANAEGWADFASLICEFVIGERFESRVREDYLRLPAGPARNVYILGSVLSRATRGVPLGLAASALDIAPRALEELLSDDEMLGSLCVMRNGKIRPRHHRHAEILMETVVRPLDAVAPLTGLAVAIAPLLNINAIRSATQPYRMAVTVLDQENLTGWIGAERLEDLYAGIEPHYAWNSRYWEQRALAASAMGEHPTAVDFSRKAIGAHRDAFSLNTAASVAFRALFSQRHSPVALLEGYWKAVALVRSSRDLARDDSEYPFVTFFSQTTTLARRLRSDGVDVDARVRSEWRDWDLLAKDSLAFRDPIGTRKLNNFKWNWLRTGVAAE